MSKRSPDLEFALVRWRRRFPEITEEEALADLCWDIPCQETYAANDRRMAEAENSRRNVFNHPNNFHGWHIAKVEQWKPLVYRFEITRWTIRGGAEKLMGYCKSDVLRVAIEQKLCTRPNGFMLP